jgi:psp operon transcriptional activator
VDVRVIGSANVDLPALAATGDFRADLLDRLAFDVVTLPPLRARPADVLPLATHFATEMAREMGHEVFRGFSGSARTALCGYAWPGNVRELRNVVERAVGHHTDSEKPVVAIEFDPFASRWRLGATEPPRAGEAAVQQEVEGDFTERVSRFESALIDSALRDAQFNQTVAAESLGLGYHQFRRLMKKHGLGGNSGGSR